MKQVQFSDDTAVIQFEGKEYNVEYDIVPTDTFEVPELEIYTVISEDGAMSEEWVGDNYGRIYDLTYEEVINGTIR